MTLPNASDWSKSLEAFFDLRGRSLAGAPTAEDLCYISGRDPRLWLEGALYDNMIDSILLQAGAGAASSLLEVGCAAGFVARGLAPWVGRYTGVDLARGALEVARRLELPNARFYHSRGGDLPYPDNSFDAAICYDVYTNFPTFEDGADIIREMVRVVRPGGRVMVGSVPDAAVKDGFEKRVQDFAVELEATHGPAAVRAAPEPRKRGLFSRLFGRAEKVQPQITCYYFDKADFQRLGADLAVEVEIHDIHALNPYHGFRFNAVFRKPPA